MPFILFCFFFPRSCKWLGHSTRRGTHVLNICMYVYKIVRFFMIQFYACSGCGSWPNGIKSMKLRRIWLGNGRHFEAPPPSWLSLFIENIVWWVFTWPDPEGAVRSRQLAKAADAAARPHTFFRDPENSFFFPAVLFFLLRSKEWLFVSAFCLFACLSLCVF